MGFTEHGARIQDVCCSLTRNGSGCLWNSDVRIHGAYGVVTYSVMSFESILGVYSSQSRDLGLRAAPTAEPSCRSFAAVRLTEMRRYFEGASREMNQATVHVDWTL